MENFECNTGDGSDQFYDIKGEYFEWYSDSEQMKTEPEAKILSREKQLEAEKLELQKKLKLNLTRYISCLKKFRHWQRQTSRTQAPKLFTKGDSISCQSKETQTEETQINETQIEKIQIKGNNTKETQTKETQTEPEPDQGFVSSREIEQDSKDADIPNESKALRKAHQEEKEASKKNAWRRISLILDEEVQSFLEENHTEDEEHHGEASTLSPLNSPHPESLTKVNCFPFPRSRSASPLGRGPAGRQSQSPSQESLFTPLQLEDGFPQRTRAPDVTMANIMFETARRTKQVIKRDDVLILETVETDSDVPEALPQGSSIIASTGDISLDQSVDFDCSATLAELEAGQGQQTEMTEDGDAGKLKESCHICGKQVPRMDTHTCYECFYCDKKFQTKEILFNHIESMHLGEKTKKCDGTRMWGPNLKLRKRYQQMQNQEEERKKLTEKEGPLVRSQSKRKKRKTKKYADEYTTFDIVQYIQYIEEEGLEDVKLEKGWEDIGGGKRGKRKKKKYKNEEITDDYESVDQEDLEDMDWEKSEKEMERGNRTPKNDKEDMGRWKRKKNTKKYEDEDLTDEDGIDEEVQEDVDLEEGEENVGRGKGKRKAKGYESEDITNDEAGLEYVDLERVGEEMGRGKRKRKATNYADSDEDNEEAWRLLTWGWCGGYVQ